MKKIIKAMLAAVVTASIFAFAGSAIADKPVCTDADGNEIACERGRRDDSESADGTGGTESADGTGGTESADGTGTESADGTGTETEDGTGIESADGTGGTESADDPEGT
ncbi:MAG: hypothetical protein O6844_06035 [Gammaproteobacteria bacterium]|nr:hypothetical protein [Gammaproteobacteria bacterium]